MGIVPVRHRLQQRPERRRQIRPSPPTRRAPSRAARSQWSHRHRLRLHRMAQQRQSQHATLDHNERYQHYRGRQFRAVTPQVQAMQGRNQRPPCYPQALPPGHRRSPVQPVLSRAWGCRQKHLRFAKVQRRIIGHSWRRPESRPSHGLTAKHELRERAGIGGLRPPSNAPADCRQGEFMNRTNHRSVIHHSVRSTWGWAGRANAAGPEKELI